MYTLGIWDGHDAGACIVDGNDVKVAVNEERLTKKKLDVGFPQNSIIASLEYMELKPRDISTVAITTTDFAKTLTRIFPILKDKYYLFRRRKIPKPHLIEFRKYIKYRTTEIKELPFCKKISEMYFRKKLNNMGFKNFKIELVDHHTAHAASASLCSGFKKSLVVTLDGVGDGLSGTVNTFNNGELERISEISARDSFGIFYEQVTTLLGMRELEDEGKVMALSDYSYKIPDEENKVIDFFRVDGLNVKCKYSTLEKYSMLKKILWNTPREELAYMAQRTLEKHVCQLFENAIDETGIGSVCWSGGLASNIKINLRIRQNPKLREWFVFPHMGDGGLAVGAALYANLKNYGITPKKIENIYWGQKYSESRIKEVLDKYSLNYESRNDLPEYVGELISKGNFVLWYQDRMEYGPRALGNRSILAPAGSLEIKDKLNLQIKKRDWFQPFCPSLLEEDSERIFTDATQYDRFMTMGYMTETDIRDKVAAVINVDGSARPQMLGDENPKYRRLIEQVKKNTGLGIILNTSFNLHGYPIVNSPEDAVTTMLKTKARYMGIGNFFIELK